MRYEKPFDRLIQSLIGKLAAEHYGYEYRQIPSESKKERLDGAFVDGESVMGLVEIKNRTPFSTAFDSVKLDLSKLSIGRAFTAETDASWYLVVRWGDGVIWSYKHQFGDRFRLVLLTKNNARDNCDIDDIGVVIPKSKFVLLDYMLEDPEIQRYWAMHKAGDYDFE